MTEDSILLDRLRHGVAAMGQPALQAAQEKQLIEFVQLLFRWNKAYNLTAVQDPQTMLVRHLLDSLSVRPYLEGACILDVGTGAGLPGIPLAIAEPGRHFVLLDSLGKRITFLRQVVLSLGLPNVALVQGRIEAYRPAEPPSCVISRAFARFHEYLAAVEHLLAPGVCVLAMKGRAAEAEAEEGRPVAGELTLIPLAVPGLDEVRVLLRWIPADPAGGSDR